MLGNFFCRLCSFFYLPDNFFQVLCSFAEAAGSLFPKVKNVKVEASECPIFPVRYAPQLGGRFIGPSYKKTDGTPQETDGSSEEPPPL